MAVWSERGISTHLDSDRELMVFVCSKLSPSFNRRDRWLEGGRGAYRPVRLGSIGLGLFRTAMSPGLRVLISGGSLNPSGKPGWCPSVNVESDIALPPKISFIVF